MLTKFIAVWFTIRLQRDQSRTASVGFEGFEELLAAANQRRAWTTFREQCDELFVRNKDFLNFFLFICLDFVLKLVRIVVDIDQEEVRVSDGRALVMRDQRIYSLNFLAHLHYLYIFYNI